jgi:hypothetical protein
MITLYEILGGESWHRRVSRYTGNKGYRSSRGYLNDDLAFFSVASISTDGSRKSFASSI